MAQEETQGEATFPFTSSSEGEQPADRPGAWAGAGWPEPGQTWGKYLIEKRLGRGGQAAVFQAYDRFAAAGHVALKVPRHPIAAEQAQAWAAAEAEPLVQLDHPNIVRVLDAGCVGGVPYVATGLVKGLRLDDHVKNRPPSLRRILNWMIQLADAVAYAHERGITHRDLKPQNVLVSRDQPDCPKIIDFALARLIDPYRVPEGDGISGTPAFMAPEQARGDDDADHRVDVFALGAILKFLLEARGPYPAASDSRQALEAAKENKVEPADADTGPPLRRTLARIANKALQADPARRFQNAREMLGALRSLRSRRVVLAATASAACLAAAAAAGGLLFRAPATATLEIHFQRPGEGDVYHVLSAKSGPLRTGDRIQIHARLSEPLYACVVAVDPKGRIQVLYPTGSAEARPTTKVDLPPERDEWSQLEEPAGTETVLLLARRQPLRDPKDLKAELASLGSPPELPGPGLIVADHDGVRIIERRVEPDRSISTRTTKAKKGMLASLLEHIPEKWTLVRGLCFFHGPATRAENEAREGRR